MNLAIINRYTLLALILVPTVLFITTFDEEYDVAAFAGDVSTVFVPQIFLLIWIGLAVAAFFVSRQSFNQVEESDAAVENELSDLPGSDLTDSDLPDNLGDDSVEPESSFLKLLLIMIISIVTAIAMLNFGFVLAVVPGFFLFCWQFGYRKPLPLLVISLTAVFATWYIFNSLLSLPLPRSPWFLAF